MTIIRIKKLRLHFQFGVVGVIFSFLLATVSGVFQSTSFGAIPGPLEVGAASKVINNNVGGWVQAAGVPKRATRIRDDLEANVLYLSNDQVQLLIISCDLAGLLTQYANRVRKTIGDAVGISYRNVIISATHTHGGPNMTGSNYLMSLDEDYMDRLEGWLVDLAQEAMNSVKLGKIGWGKGHVQIGFNRRLTWADGTHTMHGDSTREDFTGLEGPDDPQHLAIFVADVNDKLIAVLHHNTSHPTIFYGDGIYSADFPGEARKILRGEFGEIPVLFINGAEGDIAIDNMLNRREEPDEKKLERVGRLVADETLRLYRLVNYSESPILAHTYEDLKLDVRLPKPERLVEARKVLARIDAGENIRGMEMIMAYGAVKLQEHFGENPIDTLEVHGIRIGDVALVTQPCELYCQFGLDIKRRSPAPITAILGLTNGRGGYCPTIYATMGGGYSGEPIDWTRLEPYAGYKIVESASRQLNILWRQPETN